MAAANNGGRTDYYALPKPSRKEILEILVSLRDPENNTMEALEKIYALLPQTLNDLIEHQEMLPWQHEVFKATYALNARAEKNGGSKLREINKILYYAERGKRLVEKEELKEEGNLTRRRELLEVSY